MVIFYTFESSRKETHTKPLPKVMPRFSASFRPFRPLCFHWPQTASLSIKNPLTFLLIDRWTLVGFKRRVSSRCGLATSSFTLEWPWKWASRAAFRAVVSGGRVRSHLPHASFFTLVYLFVLLLLPSRYYIIVPKLYLPKTLFAAHN